MSITQRHGRKFWTTLMAAVITATGGTIVITQQTASAASQDVVTTQCRNHANVICFFDLPRAHTLLNAGALARFSLNDLRGKCRGLQQLDNKAGSVYTTLGQYMDRAYVIDVYPNANCTGDYQTMGYRILYTNSDLSSWGMNNKLSSFKVHLA